MEAEKFIRPLVLALSLFPILLGTAAAYALTRGAGRSPAEGQDRWLLLLYDDGDFTNGYDPLFDFAAEAFAHENLDILVLADNFYSPAVIWRIGANHEIIPQKFLGEINMADSANLEYFLKFAADRFPNRRTILCFYDHGGGWQGACIDETNSAINPKEPTILAPASIRSALEKAHAVDLICFTAPCNMGSIEAAYELRRNTAVYIGSEDTSGYVYWFGTIQLICETLKSRPAIDNYELATAIVRSTAANTELYWPQSFHNYTMSAARSDRLDAAGLAIRALSTAALNARGEAFPAMNQALGDIRYYGADLADVIDIFDKALERCQSPSLREAFRRAGDAVRQAVIFEMHPAELPGSNGLNIYFPPPPDSFLNGLYNFYASAFPGDSGWFALLEAYYDSWPGASRAASQSVSLPRTNGFYPVLSGEEKAIRIRRTHPGKRNGAGK